ncbi:hypothetical protein COOONC_03551 [Cooperia oncophora]
MFHLSECNKPIDGHDIIISLYNLEECEVAVELAEKFKDFKVLVKVCLDMDDKERRAKLDAYKQRFAADEFDMYLCRYLKQKKSEIASQSLLSLADRENSDVKRQRHLYAFAKLAAACSDAASEDVINEANRKLVLIKHQ